MKVKEPELGGIALSLTGRDKGRCFIIEEIIDDNYVYITDGMLRKVAHTKKKKIKHLELKPLVFESIAEKFKQGTKVFDKEVASAIMSSEYYVNKKEVPLNVERRRD